MKPGTFLAAVSGALLVSGGVSVRAWAAEIVVKAQKETRIDEGVTLTCTTRDDRNFKGYPLAKSAKPYVVSLSWQMPQTERALMMLNEDAASRMQLVVSGVSYPPRALGSDKGPPPPPPPPGGRAAAVPTWGDVPKLLLYKGGGRFFFMEGGWARDFLFEVPASSGPASALRFEAIIAGKPYAVRCDLGG